MNMAGNQAYCAAVSGLSSRSQLLTTVWAVMGTPSLQVVWRSLNVQVSPSSLTVQLSASPGIPSQVLGSFVSSPSNKAP